MTEYVYYMKYNKHYVEAYTFSASKNGCGIMIFIHCGQSRTKDAFSGKWPREKCSAYADGQTIHG